MQKTGLITFHFAHHYGAQLQAYALMTAIDKLGGSCEIIDYRLPHTTKTNQLFKKSDSLYATAANAHTLLHYRALRTRFDRFNSFVTENMHLSERRYTSFDELADHPPGYDLYVTGSDQIWNPFIFESGHFDPSFFLAFTGDARRISYAPSFGVSSIPDEMHEELKGYLSHFSALSVRERQGQKIVSEISDRQAKPVLDPTLLLSGADWGSIAAAPKDSRPYILCYFISDYSALVPYAERLAAETGLRIVHLAGVRRKVKDAEIVFDAGPREFLGLFQNAAYVLTNSFHGTVFSVQFQKPFFTTVSPKELENPTHSRIFNLLDTLGLTSRIIGTSDEAGITESVDYGAVYQRLETARAQSLAFLKAGLDGEAVAEKPAPTITSQPRKIELCSPAACTGCGACFNICPHGAIEMRADAEGFLSPHILEHCKKCGLCMRTCPILAETPGRPEGSVFAAWNQDEGIRAHSTSGGFFSILAESVISQGGVVFGAAFDSDLYLRHTSAETSDELAALRYAKYVQSDTNDVFRRVKAALNSGRQVLFSGTPCQVDGLYHCLGKDFDNLLTCDLVCHGVPSPGVFQASIGLLEENQKAKAVNVLFRDKSEAWNHPRLTVQFDNHSITSMPLMQSEYGRGFGMALFLRPSCHQCRYAQTTRKGDFTLGDFWGIDPNSLPGGADKGVSLVLVNSDKAKSVFTDLGDRFDSQPRTPEEALRGNPRLARPLPAPSGRTAFFSSYRLLPFREVSARYLRVPPLAYRAAAKILSPKVKEKLRKIIKR